VVKNKVAPPFRVCEFDMMADSGISVSGGVLDVATEMNIIEKAGSFFKYNGKTMAQGREAAKAVLEEDEALMTEIKKKVWDEIKKAKTPMPMKSGANAEAETAEDATVPTASEADPE
jgi:recombination protein RecA